MKRKLKIDDRENFTSKCPYNEKIDCTPGVFCDGCRHEFDDKNYILNEGKDN